MTGAVVVAGVDADVVVVVFVWAMTLTARGRRARMNFIVAMVHLFGGCLVVLEFGMVMLTVC